ncbi:hypothetical protein ACH5RR_016260 [Cinchona calisaya]|uniref:PPM-type phosphatase domain-containing protein n=1 Tax=Cinchona calisaya TaxID=153742 RepID=A0ABD2ZVD0_9GENT
MAVIQANNVLEDHSQVESVLMSLGEISPRGTFVGIYDGYAGPEAARFHKDELRSAHPHDPQIVILKHKVWRVKGLIQISRSIGDAYLKKTVFNREPLLPKFRLPEPFQKPILKAEPSMHVQKLYPEDQFLIFASVGLWEHLIKEEAVEIVHTCPRNGIARKLVKAALSEAAKKREMRYSDLKKIDRGVRRHFHDDITVVVVYLDSPLISRSSFQEQVISVRGGGSVGDANI